MSATDKFQRITKVTPAFDHRMLANHYDNVVLMLMAEDRLRRVRPDTFTTLEKDMLRFLKEVERKAPALTKTPAFTRLAVTLMDSFPRRTLNRLLDDLFPVK